MSSGGTYDPHAVEHEIYAFWEKGGCFHAAANPDKRPFVIDIPLPNVTGALHLGHAINNTCQDVLIRHKRMAGFEAMWMPGTDHAGIATQAVVERKLKEEQNLTRHELGREGLVAKIWEWKEEYGSRILNQLRKIGSSCDWERARFTLDEVCAKAVYEVFFRWFADGLIYRGLRLVNWDTALQTAVADDEVIHENVKGHFWKYRYPVEGCNATGPNARFGVDYIVIATTRPETMLGDTAVCVHPDDERYKGLIGKNCILPLMGRPIPIIADGLLAKPELGTGCVKVTPGHDPNDYACGLRHNLPMINILTPDGKINEKGGPYKGMTREDARKKVVEDLEKIGLMESVEDYEHAVGHSDRSKTPIEPLLSEQWFLKMGELAESAMEAVRDGRVQFFPARYAKTMLDWLGEKRDWCISRQLWWGHRIPVWTKRMSIAENDELLKRDRHAVLLTGDTGEVWCVRVQRDNGEEFLVSGDPACLESYLLNVRQRVPRDEPLTWRVCPRHQDVLVGWRPDEADANWTPPPSEPLKATAWLEENGFTQDPDVLDTWFSSALWPFSTLGWPDENPDLDYFYPTSVLVTGRDIITLWVARMIITGLYFKKRVPFQHVCIHPNIQDGQGRRMSKSIGNGVDPVDIINIYGADALRFTMAQMASETQDARLPVSYLCPHCDELIAQSSVVPHNKVPRDITEVTCKGCKKPFATVWATPEKQAELGLGVDTSERFELGRNLCNKLWQATTGFVLPNLDGGSDAAEGDAGPRALEELDLAIEDRWILSRLAATIGEIDRRFARYQINEIANQLYGFFWSDFCDWYVELVKPRLFERDAGGNVVARSDESAEVARQVLAFTLDQVLRLMHPVIPFITEALWKQLAEKAPRRGLTCIADAEPALITAAWPDASSLTRDTQIEREMEAIQNVIRALRDALARINTSRSAAKQPAIGKLPRALIRAEESLAAGLNGQIPVLERLGRCEAVEVGSDVAKPPESATQVLAGVEVYVPLAGLMDLAAERGRLAKERDKLQGHVQRLAGKLSNEGFMSKAPQAVVEQERERLAEMKERLSLLERNLADIEV
jgi:valyl-tRNA synthetase